jgi:Ca2+/H+ antiporter
MYTSDAIGGLLNATFGNATEMIIATFAMIEVTYGVCALRHGLPLAKLSFILSSFRPA